MDLVKVVIRYADGHIIKGFTNDFFPNKPQFHIRPDGSEQTVDVLLRNLKAVFFVKEFGGDPSHKKVNFFAEGQRPQGRKVEVRFRDGEVMAGTTLGFDPARPGFFLTPADPQSNNLRVFVVSNGVEKVGYL
jgi:hypothetical protein